MASKWDKLSGKVPEAPAADMTSWNDNPAFAAKVDEAKATLSTLSLPELEQQLVECNQEWDDIQFRLKELNVQFEALGQLIRKQFEALGQTSMKDVNGRTFRVHVEPLVSVKKGRREEAEAWVASKPELDYLWSIHPQSLASLVKASLEKLEDEKTDDDQIPEFVDVFLKKSIRVQGGN